MHDIRQPWAFEEPGKNRYQGKLHGQAHFNTGYWAKQMRSLSALNLIFCEELEKLMRKHGVGSVNVIRDETTFEMSRDETQRLAEEHGATTVKRP